MTEPHAPIGQAATIEVSETNHVSAGSSLSFWRQWLAPRPGNIMPAAGATGPVLMFVIAVMSFLASLALGASVTLGRTAANWSTDIGSALTVQIKPISGDPAGQLAAVMAVLEATPGILEATPIADEDAAALLEPWLGAGNVIADLPLPKLIDITIDADAPPDIAELATRVAAAAPGAALDTHRQWQAGLIATARSAQWLALAIVTLMILGMLAIVAFATSAGMSANRAVIEVLHLIGARDQFIASQVQLHFLRLGAQGSLIGAVAAALTFLTIDQIFAQAAAQDTAFFVPLPGLAASDYAALLAIPLIATLASALTARTTVLRQLARMP